MISAVVSRYSPRRGMASVIRVSFRLVPAYREHAPLVSPQQQKTRLKQYVSSLSERVLPSPGRASLEAMAREFNYIATGNIHAGGLFTGSRCLPVFRAPQQ